MAKRECAYSVYLVGRPEPLTFIGPKRCGIECGGDVLFVTNDGTRITVQISQLQAVVQGPLK